VTHARAVITICVVLLSLDVLESRFLLLSEGLQHMAAANNTRQGTVKVKPAAKTNITREMQCTQDLLTYLELHFIDL
jgi:hypothetical protein